MLILTRKPNQKIRIDGNITVTILHTTCHRVRVGIEAPVGTTIARNEILSEAVVEKEEGPISLRRAR
jgi:carbon storage regulator CsrA